MVCPSPSTPAPTSHSRARRFGLVRAALLLLFTLLALRVAPAEAARVKDIATLYGVRDNVLSGQGLVTGLNRSGDSRRNEAAIRALANKLQGLGFTISTDEIIARNVAIVMVTARMAADARPGAAIDVEVSSSGDATSLEGGVLQLAALYAPNGQVFATAQGPLLVGGFQVEAEGSSTRKNHPTVGRIPEGAIVERENPNRLDLDIQERVDWIIHQPDFTTTLRVADAINQAFGEDIAKPRDRGSVSVRVPERYKGRVVELVSQIESLTVAVDATARVVVNERTGTVVMGADVKISPVAIAYGALSIEVQRTTDVSQPGPLSGGKTVKSNNANLVVKEGDGELVMVEGISIGELVKALNKIGVKPRDLIQILMAIKSAGALQAELEVQ
jgi:flagellar P-ring protein precursor FlgI